VCCWVSFTIKSCWIGVDRWAGLQVVGSFGYSWDDFEESLTLLALGRITTQHVVTHLLPLEQIDEALRLIRERRAVKVVLRP
jgi:threonine dehydrogenase-like Zn-dependent dehydrogenase